PWSPCGNITVRFLLSRDSFIGLDSIIAASRRRQAGRASVLTSAFWTLVDFQKTTLITLKQIGCSNRCCTFFRIGTGQAKKDNQLTSGALAVATLWNYF